MIKHIRHIIDLSKQSFIVIYTNHSIVVFIFRQTTLITFNTNKFNLRLIRASQYFFNFNIVIRYETKKFNMMSNVFLRLSNKKSIQSNFNNKIDVLNILYDNSMKLKNHEFRIVIIQNLSIITYYVILMKMFDDFRKRFKLIYDKNKY